MPHQPLVLLVEGDRYLRMLFELVLLRRGFDVQTAEDGLAALYCIEAYTPDVIVLNLNVPRVSGADVLAELESAPRTRDIPVVVITDAGDKPAHANVRRTLRKPVGAAKLVAAVDAVR